jgi:uncharacterized SAM-binding protein YcdF (DUF218 family)
MFMMRKIVAHFLFPVPLCVEVLLLGLYLLWFTRKQRAGKVVVTLGALLLVALSNTVVAEGLIRVLESRYPPFVVSASDRAATSAPRYVAVLGGWANNDPQVPITSNLSHDLMVRVVEGVRLYRALPGSKLVVSGYSGSAQAMATLAQALGVDPQDILPVPEPRDTEEEAHRISALAGHAPLVLVTSAAHMPRAMGLFEKVGTHPHPAPTDYLAPQHVRTPDEFFPNANDLSISEVAFYEYLGLAWAKLRGKI